jgi:hypothetical protein
MAVWVLVYGPQNSSKPLARGRDRWEQGAGHGRILLARTGGGTAAGAGFQFGQNAAGGARVA